MKVEIPLNKSNRLINSGQLVLVTSAYKDKRNIITLAWHMPLSHTPPLLGIGVAKTHFTSELIRKQEQFIVNVPSADLLDQAIYCGTHSGRGVDKFKETKLTPAKAKNLVAVPWIDECIGHIECALRDVKEIGDHYLFVGEPVSVSSRQDLFEEIWKVDKVRLLFHLGGKFFTTSSKEIRVP